ncbi:MAG: hypothetical protein RLZZ216_1210, partial [Cyanobacteriota bacterium]
MNHDAAASTSGWIDEPHQGVR